ncbi:MAG: SpoIIE family protein phosphatase [Oscillospiraceae bacterium]|nr:SpoIIE family protein phosphatase [Oscillospiraceae bacterium]
MPSKSVREMSRREQRHYSLSARTFRSLVLVSLVISAAAILFGYLLFSATVNREFRSEAWHLSKTAVDRLDKRALRRETEAALALYDGLTPEELEKNDPPPVGYTQLGEFGEIQRILTELRGDGGAIAAYIAVVDPETNRMIMVADSDDNPETYCPPGMWFDYTPEQISAFINGDATGALDGYYNVPPMPSIAYRTEDYGYRCTAGTELFELDGRHAMVFVDLDMNQATQAGRIFLLQYIALVALVAIAAALLAIRSMKKNVVDPINQLAAAAEAYTHDRIDEHRTGGHFSKLHITTGDEIENLSLAMKDMERELGDYVATLTRVTGEKERIGAELNIASQIQEGMIPSIFPAFPERQEFDIFASMHTAKEVGGDFYDFFLIDDDHLAIVMADVSGKGVPAALFMMASKILIKNYAYIEQTSPARVLELVNHQICQNNPAEMFVTTWLGIVELSTGRMKAANAGHEYPVIRRAKGAYQLYRDVHGFVLGGMDGMRYQEYELQLASGDELFLYTDGVTEATNVKNELFGTARMLSALNSAAHAANGVLDAVKTHLDDFVGSAEQFDDITMLCFRYLGSPMKKRTIDAKVDNLQQVLEFIDAELEQVDCPMKAQMQIDIAVEEIFVNIAKYAYAPGEGRAVIGILAEPGRAEITFADSGMPYDPLEREDPDVTLSAEEREIGGLGIFMVKQTMDEMRYKYEEGQNLLTLVKTF